MFVALFFLSPTLASGNVCPQPRPFWDGLECSLCPPGEKWDGENCVASDCDPASPLWVESLKMTYYSKWICNGQYYYSLTASSLAECKEKVSQYIVSGGVGGHVAFVYREVDKQCLATTKLTSDPCSNFGDWGYVRYNLEIDVDQGTCEACPEAAPNWDGAGCVATCPVEKPKPDNGVCTACPNTAPNWDGAGCVATCPVENPKSDNGVCTACPNTAPKWNGAECVEATECAADQFWIQDSLTSGTCTPCPVATPKAVDNTCTACPASKSVWDGTACVEFCPRNQKWDGVSGCVPSGCPAETPRLVDVLGYREAADQNNYCYHGAWWKRESVPSWYTRSQCENHCTIIADTDSWDFSPDVLYRTGSCLCARAMELCTEEGSPVTMYSSYVRYEWGLTEGACEACPDAAPKWNGTACVSVGCPAEQVWSQTSLETPFGECVDCPADKPRRTGNNRCEACPAAAPSWDAAKKRLVYGAGTACESVVALAGKTGGKRADVAVEVKEFVAAAMGTETLKAAVQEAWNANNACE